MRFWSQIKPLFIPDGWDKVKLLQDGMAIDGFNLYSCLSTNPSTTQAKTERKTTVLELCEKRGCLNLLDCHWVMS